MSAIFTPVAAQQKTYTQPSDGDTKPVASVTPFLQGLADGALAGPLIPFNWLPPVASSHGLNRAAYSVKEQAWYAVGDNVVDALDVSYTDGRTWKSLTSGLGAAYTLLDVAFDLAGNGIVISTSGYYGGIFSAYGSVTWSAASLPSAPSDGRVVYDPIHSKWITVYRHGSSGLVCASIQLGFSWVTQTLPASWSGYTGSAASPRIRTSGAGTLVAAFLDLVATPNKIRIIRSTDGGTTWVDEADITPQTTAPSSIDLAYDPVYSLWYLTASSGTATEVYTSADDGVTWVAISTMPAGGYTAMQLLEIACLCGVLVGLNTDGRIFTSSDISATWWFATSHRGVSGAPTGMRAGDGRLLVFDRADSTVVASLRYGPTGLEVV